MTATVAHKPLRWSSVRVCPRKAVYEATGAPAREPTDREQRIMFRGKRLGEDYADWLEREHGAENVHREVEVEWPLGTGHMDIFLADTRTAIEVLSSAHASDQMRQSKLLQLVGYMEHYEPAENGLLVILNPADFGEERYPVAKGTPTYQALVEEMRDRIDELKAWESGALVLPARVCQKPTDAIGHFCRHSQYCFDGWEPPALEEIDSPTAREITLAYWKAKQAEADAARIARARTDERKALETELAERIPEGKWRVGPLAISRTHVRRQPTVDMKKVDLAGFPIPDEFLKPGAEYDTYRVERITDDPLLTTDSFGEDPPF